MKPQALSLELCNRRLIKFHRRMVERNRFNGYNEENKTGGRAMDLGEKIQELRKRKGMSQEQLAEYLGCLLYTSRCV